MTESKAIVVAQPRYPSLEVIKIAKEIAPLAAMFGLQPNQATIAMLTGYELGLGLMTSLRFVDVIKTSKGLQPALRTQAMEALINRSGVLDEFKVTDHTDKNSNPTGCTVYMKRTIGSMVKEYSSTFTQVDAERAELADKSNWKHYPKDMYYNRALSRCARRVCADVILGLYTPDEITDGEWQVVERKPIQAEESPPQTPPKNEGGNGKEPTPEPVKASDAPIEAKKEETPASDEQAQPETVPEPEDAATIMNQLVQKYGAPAVMAANGGQIPNGLEAWQAVRDKLQADKKGLTTEDLTKAGYTLEQITQANDGKEPQTSAECEEVVKVLSTPAQETQHA